MRPLGTLLLLAVALADAAGAQTIGQKVQVFHSSGSITEGLVDGLRQDGLTVTVPGQGLVSVAYADMDSLLALLPAPDGVVGMYAGKYAGRGAAGGAVSLGALALLVGIATLGGEGDLGGAVAGLTVVSALGGALAGGGIGAIVGALRGLGAKRGKWSPIVIPGTDAALTPTIRLHGSGMPAIGLILAF